MTLMAGYLSNYISWRCFRQNSCGFDRVGLFVCLSVSQSDNLESKEWICIISLPGVCRGPRHNLLDFGDDMD